MWKLFTAKRPSDFQKFLGTTAKKHEACKFCIALQQKSSRNLN